MKKSGKNVVLADAVSPGFGTTGGTSAHINTFADTTYKEAEDAFGEKGAQLFADAINEGFQIINDNINYYKINCDYESKTGYLYAEDTDQAKQLEDVFHGAKQVGIKVRYTDDVPTPISYVKALQFDGQAFAVAVWKLTFKIHPLPPWINFNKFYMQLVPAHVVFGLFATIAYRVIKQNEEIIKGKQVDTDLSTVSK